MSVLRSNSASSEYKVLVLKLHPIIEGPIMFVTSGSRYFAVVVNVMEMRKRSQYLL